MFDRPQIVVFATGTKTGGGSGVDNLLGNTMPGGQLRAEIVGIVSNHAEGGVARIADRWRVPFVHFVGPWEAEAYRAVLSQFGDDIWVALSGWRRSIRGHKPPRTFNIHPGPLPEFGGQGMYGAHVHRAVHTARTTGQWPHDWTAVSMHFVTDEYDAGPVFFEQRVPLRDDDAPEDIQARVHSVEHEWQPVITNMVVHGQISWDGSLPAQVILPPDYPHLPRR